jgi:DNA-binding GntR family transcriptional regulator
METAGATRPTLTPLAIDDNLDLSKGDRCESKHPHQTVAKPKIMSTDHPSRMSAPEFVADTLRREILRGDLSPGQALLQDHIAARFEVSQSSVREALRRLEALSLAHSIRNRGTFVSTLSVEQVEEIYDLRQAIELLALRSNFDKISAASLAETEALMEQAERGGEFGFFGEANKKFHAMLYEREDRKLTRDLLQNLFGNLTRLWVDFAKKKPGVSRRYDEQSQREHREILKAVRARNLTAAEAVLSAHIRAAREILIKHLRQSEVPAARTQILSPKKAKLRR